MKREDMAKMRRELGLDLIKASRKAGVAAPSQPPSPAKSETCEPEEDELFKQLMQRGKSK